MGKNLTYRDERLESVKALGGRMAHDFNNSLATLIGYLTLVKQSKARHEAIQFADKGEAAGRKTEELITHLLMALRPQRRFSPAPFDLAQLIQERIVIWRKTLPSHVQIEFTFSNRLFPITADRRHWEEILENLFRNSRLALGFGGKIILTLDPCTVDANEAPGLNIQQGRYYKLEFRDTGFGIAPENIHRVFDPFFSTRIKTRAHGLGLTLVHGAIRFYGGQVDIESAPEKGTVVSLWIPETPLTLPIRSPHSADILPTEPGTVILGKFDEWWLEVAKQRLLHAHVRVILAPIPKELLPLLTKHPEAVVWLNIEDPETLPEIAILQMSHPTARMVAVATHSQAIPESLSRSSNLAGTLTLPCSVHAFDALVKSLF